MIIYEKSYIDWLYAWKTLIQLKTSNLIADSEKILVIILYFNIGASEMNTISLNPLN